MKTCSCESKYCKHYESDFDRFISNKNNHMDKEQLREEWLVQFPGMTFGDETANQIANWWLKRIDAYGDTRKKIIELDFNRE